MKRNKLIMLKQRNRSSSLGACLSSFFHSIISCVSHPLLTYFIRICIIVKTSELFSARQAKNNCLSEQFSSMFPLQFRVHLRNIFENNLVICYLLLEKRSFLLHTKACFRWLNRYTLPLTNGTAAKVETFLDRKSK